MAGIAVILQLISLFLCCASGALLQYRNYRLSGSPSNATLPVGGRERVYCLQPTASVPTAIEWYNPQGQLVSRDSRDEVNQAGAGDTATFLNFQSYQQSQGGKYECRVTGPGDHLEKLPVCIVPTNKSCADEATSMPQPTSTAASSRTISPHSIRPPSVTTVTPKPSSIPAPTAEPPSKVVGVRVTPSVQNTSPTLTVTWQAVAGTAVNYTVKYSTQPGEVNTPPEGALKVKGISGTSTILTALERGTTYYIWVVGVSEGREGPHSDRMTGVTYDTPDQVSGVRFVPSPGGNSLSVEWSRPQSDVPILYYEIQYRSNAGSRSWLGPVNVTTESVILRSSLVPSATYGVQVRAVSAIGTGPYSSEETIKLLESPKLTITSGSSWLYVEWNAQSATFRALYRESGAPDYQVIAPPTSQLSHNISALQPNSLYNIVVEATYTLTQHKVNSSATSAYTTPQVPAHLSVQVMSADSIKVSWTPAPTASSVSVTYYINASSPTYQAVRRSVTDPDREVVISGLHPFAEYYITVQAGNPGGLSESTGRSATTLTAAPSGPPVIRETRETGTHWAMVGWSIPPEAERNGIIIAYIVQLTDTHGAIIRNETVAVQDPTFDSPQSLALNLTSLKPYTRYMWRVAATTTAGAGPFASVGVTAQFRTMLGTPGPVSELSYEENTDTSVTITWQPPKEPNGDLVAYFVEHGVYQDESTRSVRIDARRQMRTSTVIRALEPGVPYNITIRAGTAVGKGEPVSIVVFTTQQAPTSQVSNVKVERVISNRAALVSWTPLTLHQARGFPVYFVTYQPTVQVGQVVCTVSTISTTETRVQIDELDPTTKYIITVDVGTAGGKVRGTLAAVSVTLAQVEVERDCSCPVNADCSSANAVGLFLGGVVAGVLGVLLIVGIVVGARRLRRTKHKSSPSSKAAGEGVPMDANPAYGETNIYDTIEEHKEN